MVVGLVARGVFFLITGEGTNVLTGPAWALGLGDSLDS